MAAAGGTRQTFFVPFSSMEMRRMATVMSPDSVIQIGEMAGQVWHTLDEHGPQSLAKLVKLIDAPRDSIMQALGWLAREDKIAIEETSRGKIVSLRREI
jgi:hypothetical protein